MAERDGKGEKLTLVEWLGYRKDTNFENNRGLGIALGFVLFFVALLLGLLALASVFLLITVVFKLFVSIPDADLGNALRGIAFALGAIVGLPFLVWRSWVAHRQADTAEQGLITDRFTKAVEQLGADKVVKKGDVEETVPNIEVRLGALYALERIAQDSERDHVPIMETICAYVRENAAKPRYTEETLESLKKHYQEVRQEKNNSAAEKTGIPLDYLPPRADIQVALTILGRRTDERRGLERRKKTVRKPYTLDLRECHFQLADISDANFEYANLDGVKLTRAQIKGANLTEARLDMADLTGAHMEGAILIMAKLNNANLSKARIRKANLSEAELNSANLSRAWLDGSNFTEAEFINADLSNTLATGATLTRANFANANLTDAHFNRADFSNAFMSDAILNCTNLASARLS